MHGNNMVMRRNDGHMHSTCHVSRVELVAMIQRMMCSSVLHEQHMLTCLNKRHEQRQLHDSVCDADMSCSDSSIEMHMTKARACIHEWRRCQHMHAHVGSCAAPVANDVSFHRCCPHQCTSHHHRRRVGVHVLLPSRISDDGRRAAAEHASTHGSRSQLHAAHTKQHTTSSAHMYTARTSHLARMYACQLRASHLSPRHGHQT